VKTSQLLQTFVVLGFLSLTVACQKEEGVGGNCSIRGVLWTRDFNSTFTTLIGTYPAADEYVYIVYGDGYTYGDRVKTDYRGHFEFPNLYPGDYTLYAYSLDSTLTSLTGNVPVVLETNLPSPNSQITVDTMIVYR
jgi:hypothetical protein